MPRICPHCRFPFDPDWGDDDLPTLCPRCGSRLAAPSANNPRAGIATFLRKPVETPAAVAPEPTAPEPHAETIAAVEPATPAAAAQPAQAQPPPATPTIAPVDEPPVATSAAIAEVAASPRFARQAPQPTLSPRAARWQWFAFVLLLLALLLQLLLADRARLAERAAWRPVLLSLCGMLHCELPPWREPQAFTMLEREVLPVSGAPGVLQVRATFRNDARWAQAWPQLQLALADADGRTLGARGFTPHEYLGRPPTGLLGSGQSAQVVFRIREPATPAASFQFEFR